MITLDLIFFKENFSTNFQEKVIVIPFRSREYFSLFGVMIFGVMFYEQKMETKQKSKINQKRQRKKRGSTNLIQKTETMQ